MKKHTLLQVVKSATFSLAFPLLVGLPISESAAEDIDIVNHSFETNTSANEFANHGNIPGWDQYNPFILPYGNGTFSPGDAGTIYEGTLNLDFPDSPWFIDGAPDGDNVLVLFTPDGQNQGSAFGVEQTLTHTLQGGSRYVFSVEVGNIASGNIQANGGSGATGTYYNLDGFPGYWVQLWLGSEMIWSESNALELANGEFGTVDCTFDIPADSSLVGQSITIRLINPNNSSVSDEVDFDNVILTREDIGQVNGSLVPAEISAFTTLTSGVNNDGSIRNFTITGKGKKRVLIAGRGLSLQKTLENRIGDPQITVFGSRGTVGKSNNWMKEDQAREIRRVPQFTRQKWHERDAALILELDPGEYSIELKNALGVEGHGLIEVYDLDRSAPAKIESGDIASAEFMEIWNKIR